jgi:hypothetical protein
LDLELSVSNMIEMILLSTEMKQADGQTEIVSIYALILCTLLSRTHARTHAHQPSCNQDHNIYLYHPYSEPTILFQSEIYRHPCYQRVSKQRPQDWVCCRPNGHKDRIVWITEYHRDTKWINKCLCRCDRICVNGSRGCCCVTGSTLPDRHRNRYQSNSYYGFRV